MMRWQSRGQSCIKPSMGFPSITAWSETLGIMRGYSGSGPAPSPVAYKVSRRAGRRNGFVVGYGTAPISVPFRLGLMPQARALAQPMCLLIVFLSLAGAGGVPAMAEDVPLPKPRPQVWV